MADEQKDTPVTAATVQADVQAALRGEQQAIAQAAREAEEKQLDETVPGGAYLLPGGRWVNAHGEDIKAPKGK